MRKPRGSSTEVLPSRGFAEVNVVHSCPGLASRLTPPGRPVPPPEPKLRDSVPNPAPSTEVVGAVPPEPKPRRVDPTSRWSPVGLSKAGLLLETGALHRNGVLRAPGHPFALDPVSRWPSREGRTRRTLRACALRAIGNISGCRSPLQPRRVLAFRVLRRNFADDRSRRDRRRIARPICVTPARYSHRHG